MIRSAALLLVVLSAPAAAQDEWDFRVTPYLWAPSLDSTLDVGPTPPASGSTAVLDILDGALLVAAEADRGDLSVFGEFNYLNLGDQFRGPRGAVAAMGLEGVLATAAAAWTVAEGDAWRLQPFAGARFWTLDASLDFRRLPAVGTTLTWVDPIVGLRGSYAVTDAVTLEGLADVGGFGVGSDLQWEALARITYRFNERIGVGVGYRHLDVDFTDGGKLLDMALSGPFAAIDVHF